MPRPAAKQSPRRSGIRARGAIQLGMQHMTPVMTRRDAKQRDRGENAKAIAEVMLVAWVSLFVPPSHRVGSGC